MAIAKGYLAEGEKIPTIRALANSCGINMMTVNKAYQMLKLEGYIQNGRSGMDVCKGQSGKTIAKEKIERALNLLAAEAKIMGFSEDDFLHICQMAYTSLDIAKKRGEKHE